MMQKIFWIGVLFLFLFNGCKLFRKEPLKVTYVTVNPSRYGAADGKIDLTITGGKEPYNIQWSNNAVTEDLDQIASGTYLVMIIDAKGKTVLVNITLAQPQGPECKDLEGNSYKTLVFGERAWMTENLKVTHSPEQKEIKSYIPGNDSANIKKYGLLYDWTTAMNGSSVEGAQGICPKGWHIPSDKEWIQLTNQFVRREAGKMLMDTTIGFNAAPAGFYTNDYFGFKVSANYWTSTPLGNNAWKRSILTNQPAVFRYHGKPTDAYSIRCVKDSLFTKLPL